MNTERAGTALACLTLLTLSACAGDNSYLRSMPDNFGEASRQTLAAQIIDPDPQYDTVVPATSAEHAAAAIDRYHKGGVKAPPKESTTSGTGGGSSSSGGS